MVLECIDRGIALDDLPIEEYKSASPAFGEDIYDAISMKTCVERRNIIGAPGPTALKAVIAMNEEYLQET